MLNIIAQATSNNAANGGHPASNNLFEIATTLVCRQDVLADPPAARAS